MTRKVRVLLVVLVGCACLIGAAIAFASETFTTKIYFTPDKLGAPANISASTVFALNGTTVPTPIGHVVAYGPAGLTVNTAGAGTCQKALLEEKGPSGCPADSRIGFGGGLGLVEIGKEFIKEPYTLDFFLAPSENGRLAFLIYAQGVSPVSVELVVLAKEIYGTKPYGLGVEFDIPPIPTLPGRRMRRSKRTTSPSVASMSPTTTRFTVIASSCTSRASSSRRRARRAGSRLR